MGSGRSGKKREPGSAFFPRLLQNAGKTGILKEEKRERSRKEGRIWEKRRERSGSPP